MKRLGWTRYGYGTSYVYPSYGYYGTSQYGYGYGASLQGFGQANAHLLDPCAPTIVAEPIRLERLAPRFAPVVPLELEMPMEPVVPLGPTPEITTFPTYEPTLTPISRLPEPMPVAPEPTTTESTLQPIPIEREAPTYAPVGSKYKPYYATGSTLQGFMGGIYEDASRAQDELSILNAALNAIGQDVYDKAVEDIRSIKAIQDWIGIGVHSTRWFNEVHAMLVQQLQNVLVTVSRPPSSSRIAEARSFADTYRKMVNYVKGLVPEVASKVNEWEADMRAKLAKIPTLQDPAVVGWDTFKAQITERLSKLPEVGANWLPILLGAGALLFLSRGGIRMNPGISPLALAAGAGLAYLIFSKKADAAPATLPPATVARALASEPKVSAGTVHGPAAQMLVTSGLAKLGIPYETRAAASPQPAIPWYELWVPATVVDIVRTTVQEVNETVGVP